MRSCCRSQLLSLNLNSSLSSWNLRKCSASMGFKLGRIWRWYQEIFPFIPPSVTSRGVKSMLEGVLLVLLATWPAGKFFPSVLKEPPFGIVGEMSGIKRSMIPTVDCVVARSLHGTHPSEPECRRELTRLMMGGGRGCRRGGLLAHVEKMTNSRKLIYDTKASCRASPGRQ